MALVGLLRFFRVAELIAVPEPASTTLERPHILLGSRRKGPHRPTLPHDPRKCARAQDKPTNSDAAPGESAQNSGGNKSNVPPHGALGGFALTATTLVASTPTSTSGVGRLGDGGATKRRGEAVSVKESVPFVIGVGRRLRSTRGLGGRGRGCRGPGGVDRWLRAKSKGDSRCNGQRDTKTQPLGHQVVSLRGQSWRVRRVGGQPVAERTMNENGDAPEDHRPDTRETTGGKPGTGRRPPAGARHPDPGWPGELPRASRRGPAVRSVSRSQV